MCNIGYCTKYLTHLPLSNKLEKFNYKKYKHMFFQHIFEKSLAHSSYIIGCQAAGQAMVIDPKRDIDTYLKIAEENNLKITHIAETHIHADYLSGSQELAYVTGAKMYLSDEGGQDWQYDFEHVGLKNGDTIEVGNLIFEIMHTPGHTPESISFLLTDTPATKEPVMIFTGDFVFVGDIGRPDLLEAAAGLIGTKEVGAKQMFESLKKFQVLPDYLQVWPAHGAGSACGKALGAVASSTVGYEKIRNWALQFENNEKGFTDYLLADQPEAPAYFAMMKKLNKIKRPLLIEVPKWTKLSFVEFEKAKNFGMKVIDARMKADFSLLHLPGTVNIQHNKTFNTWMGWMVNYQEQIVMIVNEDEVEEMTRKLMRIGLDNVYGFITPKELIEGNESLTSSTIIDADKMETYIGQDDVQILDVRGEKEFIEGHIEGAQHIFVGYLPKRFNELDLNKKIVLHCQAGDRATIAQSFLESKGFEVENYSAGMADWKVNKKPLVK